MTTGKMEAQIHYKSIPNKNRFWLHPESSYTEDELNFRLYILKARASSGINPDYLATTNTWFAPDDQAFININTNSWVYSETFTPRHVLNLDDFHVQPIDEQRLQWPMLQVLMQNVGDYLLIRNQELPKDKLNQPMNFFLLDVNNILKGLSFNSNINQVYDELENLTKYLHVIEKNLSPLVGSDKLFLARLRTSIDEKIHPQLIQLLESQLLKEKLHDLSKTINKLSTDRNRILHFALNTNPVNPHSYSFSTEQNQGLKPYPTQAAKGCSHSSSELTTDPIPPIKLTKEQLKDCPDFALISMTENTLAHYAAAISDLNELERFQRVIAQVIDLLGQAGEVYTIYQFKEQTITLLEQINGFIDSSSLHIEEIIRTNTQAYQQAIQDQQNFPRWEKLLTPEQIKLKYYIKNQDTLAQFPSTLADLSKTSKSLQLQVNQVISHLNQPKTNEISFTIISDKASSLNSLMNSMHFWIKTQYELKGLEAPPPPKQLLIENKPAVIPPATIEPIPVYRDTHYPRMFSALPITNTPYEPNEWPDALELQTTHNDAATLSLMPLLPLMLLFLYLLMPKTKPVIRATTVREWSS